MKTKKFLSYLLILNLFFLIHVNVLGENIPRPEYPRPQFERKEWKNLNGEWSYVFDYSKSGVEYDFKNSKGFGNKIIVPFCPESELSGVNHKDFIPAMWYQRTIKVTDPTWKGKRIKIHFGAVDYQCELFIDGKSAGIHFGGSSSFEFDITDFVKFGEEHNLVLYVQDDMASETQPRGKQCDKYEYYGCLYSRVTGIWQTVWLEAVDRYGLKDCYIVPDLDNSRFVLTPTFYYQKQGLTLKVSFFDGQKLVSKKEVKALDGSPVIIDLKKPKTWSPESPFLYDVVLEVLDGKKVIDHVKSYAGLRKIHIEGDKIYLNNKPIYLRFALDQGYYPEGAWTAPSDEALKQDVMLGLKAGFNGARLHQKVFEERFHYWADRLGYLTWGESASWGGSSDEITYARNFITEWEEVITRDRNHPSIIGWVPFNENYWDKEKNKLVQLRRLLTDVYDCTKRIDPTRPLNNSSGGLHIKTDLYTTHQYNSDPESIKKVHTLNENKDLWLFTQDPEYVKYEGQPYLLDEIGGMGWIEKPYSKDSWSYTDFKDESVFMKRLSDLMDAFVSFDYIAGYCYTQLFDIQQEQNGIYNYDRTEKFDMKQIHEIFSREPESYKNTKK